MACLAFFLSSVVCAQTVPSGRSVNSSIIPCTAPNIYDDVEEGEGATFVLYGCNLLEQMGGHT